MNQSMTLQEGMTHHQIQQAITTRWPLLKIMLFLPTPAFYKEGQFADDAYVESGYILHKQTGTTDPILVDGDMSEKTLHSLLYQTYGLESRVVYRNNPYGRHIPGDTLDQQQETIQHWWTTFAETHGRSPNANDVFTPIEP